MPIRPCSNVKLLTTSLASAPSPPKGLVIRARPDALPANSTASKSTRLSTYATSMPLRSTSSESLPLFEAVPFTMICCSPWVIAKPSTPILSFETVIRAGLTAHSALPMVMVDGFMRISVSFNPPSGRNMASALSTPLKSLLSSLLHCSDVSSRFPWALPLSSIRSLSPLLSIFVAFMSACRVFWGDVTATATFSNACPA